MEISLIDQATTVYDLLETGALVGTLIFAYFWVLPKFARRMDNASDAVLAGPPPEAIEHIRAVYRSEAIKYWLSVIAFWFSFLALVTFNIIEKTYDLRNEKIAIPVTLNWTLDEIALKSVPVANTNNWMRESIEKPLLIEAADENGGFVEIANWIHERTDNFGNRSKFRIIVSRGARNMLLNGTLRLGPIILKRPDGKDGPVIWAKFHYQPGRTLLMCKPNSGSFSMRIKSEGHCDFVEPK